MDTDVRQLLDAEEGARERGANHLRLGILTLFLLIFAAFYLKSEQHYTAGYIIFTNFLVLLLYSLLLEWRLRRRGYHPVLKYLSFAADLTGVSILVFSSLFLSRGPSVTGWVTVIGVYFLFIALTGLRFSPRLSTFTGAFTAGEFMLVNELSKAVGGDALPAPQEAALAVLMVAAGIVLAASVRQARRLVVRIGQSERDRAHLRSVAEASKRLALTDELTGLYNRRHFQDMLQREVIEAEKTGRALAAMIVDVDNFKEINDRFGHQAGDEVLRRIALLLTQYTRASDVAARVGGDEFGLVLSPIELTPARASAERLCEAVRQLSFEIGHTLEGVRISATIGLACFPHDARDLDSLMDAADKALYLGKNLGKGRVEAAG